MIVLCSLAFSAIASAADLAALDKKLHSPDERERRAAVIDLSGLDSKEGWDRVIDALGDVSPQVADEAEVALAKMRAPDLAAELCGKRGLMAKDPWVQAHAAGAIGSLPGTPVPAALLAPGLASKSDDTKRILCASIEKLAAAGQVQGDPGHLRSALAALAQRDDPEVRGAAILAQVKLPGGAVSVDDRAGQHEPAPFTCALVRIAQVARTTKTIEFIAACSRSEDRSVRAQVVLNLAQKPDVNALKILVGMLEVEKNKRLAFAIDGELEKLSGLSGGGKPGFWHDWLEHLGPDWQPATGAPPKERAGDTQAPKLVGMPIVSGAIAILVDFSGSTWEKRADGRTRKDALDGELKKTLESLPADTLFNVIPYTATPIPWEKALVPASPANVQKALHFFAGCKATGKGNFWDAAMLALEDPTTDTILVLTDGAPTGGHRWNIDLMRERYVERNRLRHVALDAVIVDAKKGLEKRWQAFCEATGGRMLTVDLK